MCTYHIDVMRENPFEDNAVVAEKHDEAWRV
jgi:hypothetical protein